MKKLNYFFLFLVALSIGCFETNAQDFPWPDVGETRIIEPGAPGVINDFITANGSGTYVLRRGATYLYTASISLGAPLKVIAEEGTGALPILRAVGPPQGGTEAPRPFHALGDLYLKDLHIQGWDQGGKATDNATVRLNAPGITAVVKNCVFEFNRQNIFRLNNADCKLYVEGCFVGNIGTPADIYNGFPITWRDGYIPHVEFRNNTFYNCTNGINWMSGIKQHGTFIFNNNTVVNTGYTLVEFGRISNVEFKNNLIVNPGVLGDGWEGDRSMFDEWWYFVIKDSNYVDGLYVAPDLVFDYNHIYVDPALTDALLIHNSNDATQYMFDAAMNDLKGSNNLVDKSVFGFTGFPVTWDEYQLFINDYYGVAMDPANFPGFDLNILDLDFSYPTSHPAYTAASDGGPLGDRTWFPNYTSVRRLNSTGGKVYPNPASDVLFVESKVSANRVVISNLLGQKVMDVNTTSQLKLEVPVSNLSRGMYLVSVFNDNMLVNTAKFMKE